MRFSVQVVLGVALLAVSLSAPDSAQAGWPLAGALTTPVLGFGASYVNDGSTSVHRGVDVGGQAGERVIAPLPGTVTFVGRVPGTQGATVLAVTLATEAGSVTLLPLDRAVVARGDVVAQGEEVATLAEGGDGSSSATHLHVGLRAGTLYLDPAEILMPVPAPESPGSVAVAPAAAAVAVAPVVVGDTAVAHGGARASAGGTVASGLGAVAPEVTAAEASVADGAGMTLGAAPDRLAPGVSLVTESGEVATAAESAGVLAHTGQALMTGGRLARAASAAVSDGGVGALVSRGIKMAGRGARSAATLATLAICACGALWPLWRAGGMEGPRKNPVSAVGEDVAAVASR